MAPLRESFKGTFLGILAGFKETQQRVSLRESFKGSFGDPLRVALPLRAPFV